MPIAMIGLSRSTTALRGVAAGVTAVLLLAAPSLGAVADGAAGSADTQGLRLVAFHGYQTAVPASWPSVDLTAHPHACVRFDQPAVYLGHAGDQTACPSRVIGGAPGVWLQALDARATHDVTTPMLTVPATADVGSVVLPATGPINVALEGAGVMLTAVYGARDEPVLQAMLSRSSVLGDAHPATAASFPAGQAAPAVGVSVPGDYLGQGFDTCSAPSQPFMDAWFATSGYRAVGIYIGGVSRGCGQPNLTPAWVSRQVATGWHLVPTYVGIQAPCTSFRYRMSYDGQTARSQGRAEGRDAVALAAALGLAAPSTLFADIEGYDSSDSDCVAAVMSYVSGWTYALHLQGYQAGVYSSASSGIHDLSLHYGSAEYFGPDDIWMAWWNYQADVDGGSYVPDSQWSSHRRVHQYSGNVSEGHGGYSASIDADYLDVSSAVPPPDGCPTNLDFAAYPMLSPGDHGAEVAAAQCLLASNGFDGGAATGAFGWRTAAAVEAFKASCGLPSGNSIIRRWVWSALASGGTRQYLHAGSTGPRVRKVQRALTARLQETVPISGIFDARTSAAVRSYQTEVGLRLTGHVGPPTWTALQTGW